MNLKFATEVGTNEAAEGVALAAGEARTAEIIVPAQSGVASVISHSISNEVPASITSQTAESRIMSTLQHMCESTETRVLEALKQAAVDIIENLGKQAAIQLVAAERRSAILEQELKNTRSQALAMLVRLRYIAHKQKVEDERRVLAERRKALEADAELESAQETVRRTTDELKRKSAMLEELQKRVQLDDAEALHSGNQGPDRRIRRTRTKCSPDYALEMQDLVEDKGEQFSEQLLALPETQISTADSEALGDVGASHPKWRRRTLEVDPWEDITHEPSSRTSLWRCNCSSGACGSADFGAVGVLPGVETGGVLTREVLVNTQVRTWRDKAVIRPEPQSAETDLLEASHMEFTTGSTIPSCTLAGNQDRVANASCKSTEPDHVVQNDFQRTRNEGCCGQRHDESLLDESLLECRERGMCLPEALPHVEEHVRVRSKDYNSPICLEQDDGYGGVIVNVGEAERRMVFSPASCSKQKSSPTVCKELAGVIEQASGSRPGPKAVGKRKRKEKLPPHNETKRVENMECELKAGRYPEDVAGRINEGSRESRRLMQGARQLFSLRRGRDTD